MNLCRSWSSIPGSSSHQAVTFTFDLELFAAQQGHFVFSDFDRKEAVQPQLADFWIVATKWSFHICFFSVNQIMAEVFGSRSLNDKVSNNLFVCLLVLARLRRNKCSTVNDVFLSWQKEGGLDKDGELKEARRELEEWKVGRCEVAQRFSSIVK